MMTLNKIFLALTLACSSSFLFAEGETLNLSGHWTCSGYDEHEGSYDNASLLLTLDKKHSDLKHGFGAYHFLLTEADGVTYGGEAATNGNMVAIYFENNGKDKEAQTDRGVGIATITHEMDKNKHIVTQLHKFYYEPAFQGGGNGYETCAKLETASKSK